MKKIRTSDIINDLESCDIGGINLGRIKDNNLNRKILDKKWVAIDDLIKYIDDTYNDIQRLKEKLNKKE